MKRVFLLLLLLVVALSANDLCSQEKAGKGEADSSASGNFSVKKRKEEVKLFLDKIDILGRIEKPQTAFIVQGKDPSVDEVQIDRSFFREIFRKVEKDDYRRIARKKSK